MPARARLAEIFKISVPIILGLTSQTVLNLIDTGMVRDFGNDALAAVGIASFANFMAGAPIMGLSAGVQAMAARRVGEGKPEISALPLNGGLTVCLAFGIPWVGLIALLAPWWFPMLAGNEAITEVGMPYLYCRLAATVLVGMNFSFRAFWNATGRSRLYMLTLVIMHTFNVALNWVLIYGNLGAPRLGVLGAGIANASATLLGMAIHATLARRLARGEGFLSGLPSRETLSTMLRISLPTAAQQFFFASGMTTLMALLARAGTETVAASKVLMDLTLAAMLPAMGYGMAGTTLVSQALGAHDARDAKRWGIQVALVAWATVLLISVPGLLVPELVLARFLKDPATIQLTVTPLRVIASIVSLDAIGMVLQSCLLGAGDSRRVMTVSLVMQWGALLPGVAVLVLWLNGGLLEAWSAQASYRLIQAAIFVRMWQKERWVGIRL